MLLWQGAQGEETMYLPGRPVLPGGGGSSFPPLGQPPIVAKATAHGSTSDKKASLAVNKRFEVMAYLHLTTCNARSVAEYCIGTMNDLRTPPDSWRSKLTARRSRAKSQCVHSCKNRRQFLFRR